MLVDNKAHRTVNGFLKKKKEEEGANQTHIRSVHVRKFHLNSVFCSADIYGGCGTLRKQKPNLKKNIRESNQIDKKIK